MTNPLIEELNKSFPNLKWEDAVTCVVANNLPLVKVALSYPFAGTYDCTVRLMVVDRDAGLCISQAGGMNPIQAVTLALNLADEVLADYRADVRRAKERS